MPSRFGAGVPQAIAPSKACTIRSRRFPSFAFANDADGIDGIDGIDAIETESRLSS